VRTMPERKKSKSSTGVQTQHRTPIQPKSSSGERDKENIMTKDEFTGMKRNILALLRHKDDAAPQMAYGCVQHGV